MASLPTVNWAYGFPEVCRRLTRFSARRICGWVPRVESGPGKGLRLDAGTATDLFLQGNYEGPVQDAVSSLIKPGGVFFDVGANIGFFSILAARIVGPTGGILAFEPVPQNAALIERNARLNNFNNIRVFKLALTSKTGKEELLLARYAGGAALKTAGIPPDHSGNLIVETSTLDDFVESRKVPPPDIVKIDVEGAELNVLHGMVETLRNCGPKLIIEVDDATLGKCEEKLRACQEFLSGFDYRSEVLPPSYRDGHWFVRHMVAQR